MTYVIVGIAALLVLLGIALGIAVKAAQAKGKQVKALEGDLEAARQELRRQGEYLQKKEEAQRHADEKKGALHTGDAVTDFTNSLGVFHAASKNRGN